MASFTIQLKGGSTLVFDDIIDLTAEQIALILRQAVRKTEEQWLDPETKGVKVPLSVDQRAEVIAHRDRLVGGQTRQQLIDNRRVRFTQHFLDRVALRIDDGRAFPLESSLAGMVDIIMGSTDLAKNAEWRGYGGLSYNFNGVYNSEPCSVAVTFDGQMILITVTTKTPTPQTIKLQTVIPEGKWAEVRALAERNHPEKASKRRRK